MRGADGTKILNFNDKVITKYAYYFLLNTKVPSADKYERHFKYLKDIQILLPPIEHQEKIVNKVKNIEREIEILKEQQINLNEEINKIVRTYIN